MTTAALFDEAATLARTLRGPGYRAVRLTRVESPAGVVTWTAVATVNDDVRGASGDGPCDEARAGVGDGPDAALTALCARLREAR